MLAFTSHFPGVSSEVRNTELLPFRFRHRFPVSLLTRPDRTKIRSDAVILHEIQISGRVEFTPILPPNVSSAPELISGSEGSKFKYFHLSSQLSFSA